MAKAKIDSAEKLAVFTAQEFAAVGSRLDRLEGRLERFEVRVMHALEAITRTLEFIHAEVKQARLADHDRRIERLERHVGLTK